MRASVAMFSRLNNSPVKEYPKEFKIPLNADKFGTVTYKKINDNVYDLIHSSIPDELQGQGLGTVLAERIFQHLIESGRKFKITCEFLHRVYLKNKEKYQDFVVE